MIVITRCVTAGTTVALLLNPNFPNSEARKRYVQKAARKLGQDLVIAGAGSEAEID